MNDRLFVDASVLVALLAKEPEWERFWETLSAADQRFTSPVALLEAVMVLSSATGRSPRDVERTVQELLASHSIAILPVDAVTASAAIGAFDRFGKGRHPARLNLGDCFSYACAKEHRLTLLYKGNDFARTDLA